LVVKVSGLGKMGLGVTVCGNKQEAQAALHSYMVERTLGPAAHTVLIEERVDGPELSVFGLSDGRSVIPLTPVRDHKRIFDDNCGPKTGGMGAFGPPADLPPGFMQEVVQTVLQPAIEGMAAEGNPYVGVLFAGLMLSNRGLQVLEFNARFGNPEALVLMSLLESDLVEAVLACIEGRLAPHHVRLRPGAAAAVVIASPQYPAEEFPLGLPITGVSAAAALPDVAVFHHGTAVTAGNQLVTARGRVLGVTAVAPDLTQAVQRAYRAVDHIHFEGAHVRRDIGQQNIGQQNVGQQTRYGGFECFCPFPPNRATSTGYIAGRMGEINGAHSRGTILVDECLDPL
jgi:phosphoribosylamine---glycine ligase